MDEVLALEKLIPEIRQAFAGRARLALHGMRGKQAVFC